MWTAVFRDLRTDLAMSLRSLRAAPTVTAAAVLTLSVGIGTTTAIFSVANGLLLHPLPVADPQRLATISSETALRFGYRGGAGWSYAMWDRLQPRAELFAGAFAWTLDHVDLADAGEMQPVNALFASGGFFTTLGVRPIRGRTFTPADDVRGGGPDGAVAVLGNDFWHRRFTGADGAIGSRLSIEGTAVTIVGVAPPAFRGVDVGQPFDLAMPFATEALVRGTRSLVNHPGALLLRVMLRMKPEQTVPQASAALQAAQSTIVGERAPRLLHEPFLVVPAGTGISDQLRQRYQRPLVVLAIVSALVLLIACVNVANLLLARASARRREFAIRVAVGAPGWRLARERLAEGLSLGAASVAIGVPIAAWVGRALASQLPSSGQSAAIDLPIDWRVLAFALAVATVAVVVFATAPAFYAARVPPLEALQEEGRADAGARSGLLSRTLIVAQVAVTLVLIAAAGLFIRTLQGLVSLPLGFDPNGVFVVTVNTARVSSDMSARLRVFEQLREALAAVPGITRAAGSVWIPIGTGAGGLADAGGRSLETRGQASFNVVTPGWFAAYGIPLRMGRDFDAHDGPGAPRVAVVNESFRHGVPGDGPIIGASLDTGSCRRCTVVGVVADTVYGRSLRDARPPTVYLPMAQAADLPPSAPSRLTVRIAGDLAHVAPGIATAVSRVDPRLAYTVTSLETDIEATVAQERLVARLAGVLGVIALLLSAIGLYGVASYSVTRRRGEIGIRLALGGQPWRVVTLILSRLGVLVLAGSVVGVLAAAWLSRYVVPLLYGVEPRDPVILAGAVLTLTSVAALAGCIPASRAVRVDPAHALREQ